MRSPRNDRQRHSHRKSFEDDNFYGNAPSQPFAGFGGNLPGPEVRASVKWYNAERGFGFVALSDGSGDVFLHANALQAAGYQTVSPGATLSIRVSQGQKGRQVGQVVSVDESTAEPQHSGGYGHSGGPRRPRRVIDLSNAVEMTGVVKWYNPDKGFGFITAEGGGKDVFVHASALETAGLPPLHEGQSVRMSVVQGMKGPEVGAIKID